MNKLLLSAALAAGILSAPAHAGSLHSGGWADIVGAIIEVGAAAATGYAAAQVAQQQAAIASMPQQGGRMVYYKSIVYNTDGTRTCLYDDSSWVVIRPGEDCVSYFEAPQ